MEYSTFSGGAFDGINTAISGLVGDVQSLVTTNTPVIMTAVIVVAAMGIGFSMAKKFIGKIK